MKYHFLPVVLSLVLTTSCQTTIDYDASGNFEADEVIVSAQQNGQLLSFQINEGDVLPAGTVVGSIDVILPSLQKQQTEATIEALKKKTSSPAPQTELIKKQLAVQQARKEQLLREKLRTENLVKADAATQKQLDDIIATLEQIDREMAATHQQIQLTLSSNATQTRSILSETGPLEISAKQFQEQINRGQIVNPIAGTVLTKYALKGEVTAVGKPLYKIANTDTLTLRAYLTSDKLLEIKLGQQVAVRIDQGEKAYKNYPGVVTWISAKSEFTPKTIQTKKERANLVYAIKVRVKNDGYLKIGMYGEIMFANDSRNAGKQN
jgi:HlyD family secretion protein